MEISQLSKTEFMKAEYSQPQLQKILRGVIQRSIITEVRYI